MKKFNFNHWKKSSTVSAVLALTLCAGITPSFSVNAETKTTTAKETKQTTTTAKKTTAKKDNDSTVDIDKLLEVTFKSMDENGVITVDADGDDLEVMLLNTIIPGNSKNNDVTKLNKDTAKKLNETLKDKKIYIEEETIAMDNDENSYVNIWVKKPSKKEVTKEDLTNSLLNASLISTGLGIYNESKQNKVYDSILSEIAKDAKEKKSGLFNVLKADEITALKTAYEKDVDSKLVGIAEQSKKEETKTTEAVKKDTKKDDTKATNGEGKIKGNSKTKIYHVPGGRYYDLVSKKNTVYFKTEEEATKAGYRKAKD